MNANAEEIGIAIGLVVAASMALQTALGPAMASIVEALKAAGLARDGRAGLFSLAIGTILGAAAGGLACMQSQQPSLLWVGIGAFAGLIGLGAGGVRSHMVAMGYQQQQSSDGSGGGGASSANPRPASPVAEPMLVEIPTKIAA